MIDQDLKSRHLAKFATKPCPIGYIALQYKNLMTEAKIHFIDYMGVHIVIRICMWENFQNLSSIAYPRGMWILSLNLSTIERIASPCSTKFFLVAPTELGRAPISYRIFRHMWNVFMRSVGLLWSSHWGYPGGICLHGIIEDYRVHLENLSFA